MMFRLLPYQDCALSRRPKFMSGGGGLDIYFQRQLKNPGSPTAYLKEPDSIRDLEN